MSKCSSVCELISVVFDTSIIESMFNGVKKLRRKRKDSLKKTGSMQLFFSAFMHEHNASIHTRHQNSCQYDVYDIWHNHHISRFVSPSDRMKFYVVSSWDESDATSTTVLHFTNHSITINRFSPMSTTCHSNIRREHNIRTHQRYLTSKIWIRIRIQHFDQVIVKVTILSMNPRSMSDVSQL